MSPSATERSAAGVSGRGAGWLDDQRHAAAVSQLVDAAAVLFAEKGVAAVGMGEVARAAGCSRATLYRYFDGRAALRAAFVDREAHRIAVEIAEAVAGIDDPTEQLVAAVQVALAAVRRDQTLMTWFTADNAGTAIDVAHASGVIGRLAATFVGDDPDADQTARADWLVRSIVSLLLVPGATPDVERTMVERFVAPVIVTGTQPARRRAAGETGRG